MCGSKGTSTTSSTYSPPASVQANYDYLANQAKSVAATPFQQYQGEMVAGLTPTQEAGIQNVNASAGLAQPYYGAGAGYVQQAATPFGQQQLNQYMSPYINSVANATMANLNETNAQQRQQLLGNSISQGAFGGDRSGIAQAELARQQNLASGQTMANLYQGGYGQALGQFNADQSRQLQAGSTLGQFGTGAQTAALQGAQAQLGAGAQQQAVQQAQDVANQQQFQAAQAYPFQTTQYLGNLLLGIGGQSGGTSLTNSPGPNIGSQVLGGLTTLASIPWGSDERLKENMEPVGETYDGQKIYKFNYKNDGHTMLGLSAQEVEKHNPEAVHKDGEGMRMVDYEKAVNHAAQRGHFASGGLADWMGGGVNADGLGRAHFATDGFVPYSEQPSGGSTKPLTLADVMRVSQGLLSQKVGGKTNLPDAPRAFEDTGMQDVAKQLVNATPEQRANMKANIGSLRSNLGVATVAPSDVLGQGQGSYSLGLHFAGGGLVGRHGYAGDGTVQPPAQDAQPSQDGQSLVERMTGKPMSDEARMGLLAAGLGMLSSKSPFFGVGVGEGATQGLGTYYNAIANKRAYEKQQRELELTEEQRQIERQRIALEAAKNPYEISKLQAESAASQAGLYEMRIVPGMGMVRVNKLTGKPELIGLPSNMQTTGSAGQPTTPLGIKNPEVPEVSSNGIETKEPTTVADLSSWNPTLAAPQGYIPPNQINMFDPEIAKTAKEVAEPVLKQYQTASDSADQQIYRLHEMNTQFANLPDTGIFAPGAYAEERLNAAKGLNAVVQSLGGKPAFDPNKIGAAEQISKDSFRLGTELARSLGREPGFIVQQSVQANPGINNTKMGWARITTGLEQAARYQQDKNTFLSDYYQRYGNLNGAEDTFRKLNPPEKYAERAVLSTVPAGVYSDLKKYGPDQMRSKIDSVFGQGITDLMMRQ